MNEKLPQPEPYEYEKIIDIEAQRRRMLESMRRQIAEASNGPDIPPAPEKVEGVAMKAAVIQQKIREEQ